MISVSCCVVVDCCRPTKLNFWCNNNQSNLMRSVSLRDGIDLCETSSRGYRRIISHPICNWCDRAGRQREKKFQVSWTKCLDWWIDAARLRIANRLETYFRFRAIQRMRIFPLCIFGNSFISIRLGPSFRIPIRIALCQGVLDLGIKLSILASPIANRLLTCFPAHPSEIFLYMFFKYSQSLLNCASFPYSRLGLFHRDL